MNRYRRIPWIVTGIALLLLSSRPSYAHHSFAMYDMSATKTMTGKLTRFIPGSNHAQIIFADKKTNSAGLQLADLTARPIGRHVLDPAQPNRAWEIVETKLRRSPAGVVRGWGLKVFP